MEIRANLENERAHRGVSEGKTVSERLCTSSAHNVLSHFQATAGLKVECELSGHSSRVGGAIYIISSGAPVERILPKGILTINLGIKITAQPYLNF